MSNLKSITKNILCLLLIIFMAAALAGCDDDNTGAGGSGSKDACYEIRNVSGTPWVIEHNSYPKSFDDVDAIDVSDFMVAPGDSVWGNANAETQIDYLELVELSPTTYRMTITCVAGAVPSDEDEQYVYLNPLYGQTAQTYAVTITGVYGECAVIEWDGTSFTQVK